MEPFKRLTAVAAPFDTPDIDTDMIIKGTIDRALRHVDREIFAHGPPLKRGRELENIA